MATEPPPAGGIGYHRAPASPRSLVGVKAPQCLPEVRQNRRGCPPRRCRAADAGSPQGPHSPPGPAGTHPRVAALPPAPPPSSSSPAAAARARARLRGDRGEGRASGLRTRGPSAVRPRPTAPPARPRGRAVPHSLFGVHAGHVRGARGPRDGERAVRGRCGGTSRRRGRRSAVRWSEGAAIARRSARPVRPRPLRGLRAAPQPKMAAGARPGNGAAARRAALTWPGGGRGARRETESAPPPPPGRAPSCGLALPAATAAAAAHAQ